MNLTAGKHAGTPQSGTDERLFRQEAVPGHGARVLPLG